MKLSRSFAARSRTAVHVDLGIAAAQPRPAKTRAGYRMSSTSSRRASRPLGALGSGSENARDCSRNLGNRTDVPRYRPYGLTCERARFERSDLWVMSWLEAVSATL